MSVYLIDYENVQAGSPLCGIDNLTPDDEIFLFYSDAANKIKEYYWDMFNNSSCRTHLIKLKNKGCNALDFYISVQVGICIGTRKDKIAIISNDKGFRSVLEYSERVLSGSRQNVICASCIEEARRILKNEKNIQKKIRSMLERLVIIKEPSNSKALIENKSDGAKNTPVEDGTAHSSKMLKILKKYIH